MMKLPKMVISEKDYNDHIAALLKDQECVIFLDTNILAKMYSLYDAARSEFYSWVTLNKVDERIKVPAWCIQEYTNKVIRGELGQYTSTVTASLKTNSKNLPQLIKHLTFYINDKTARDAGHTDRNDLLAKISDAQDKLLDLLPSAGIAKAIAADEVGVHEEIMNMVGDIILPSDIFSLMENCYEDYETRFANRVPPGFKDEGKGRNEIGDYIIWRELLEATKRDNIKKILYVSNDLKNDWVYPPKFIINAANTRKGNPAEEGRIYLVDPRLEYEISLAATQPVDIMIISFEQLVTSVTKEFAGIFTCLAEAVRFLKAYEAPTALTASPVTPTPTENGAIGSITGTEQSGPGGSTPADSGQDPLTPTDSPVEPLSNSSSLLPYSSEALADFTYPISSSNADSVIGKLEVLTWDVQNAAIDSIDSTLLNSATPDELFVLGRNVLQAATGSSFGADNFICRFPNNLPNADPEALQNLFNGMLYEMYFDSHNTFRGSKGKAFYLDTLYNIYRSHDSLGASGNFIANALSSYQDKVLFIPNVNEQNHIIKLAFQSIPNNGERQYYDCILTTCYIGADDISQEAEEDDDLSGLKWLRYYNNSVQEIANAIRVSRYIPTSNATFEYTLDEQPASIGQVSEFIVDRSLYI